MSNIPATKCWKCDIDLIDGWIYEGAPAKYWCYDCYEKNVSKIVRSRNAITLNALFVDD